MAYILNLKPIPLVADNTDGIKLDAIEQERIHHPGENVRIAGVCPSANLPQKGFQFIGGFQPYPEDFLYQSKGQVGYRGKVVTVKSLDGLKSWKQNHPLLSVKAKLNTSGSVKEISGAFEYRGGRTSFLRSLLPTVSLNVHPVLGRRAIFDPGGAFTAGDDSHANFLHEKLLDYESDLFFKSLDSTKIADVGSTLAEMSQLRNIFTRAAALLLKLPRGLSKEVSLSAIITNLETLAEWWLTYSYEFKPLIELGKDVYANAGEKSKAGSTFRIRSKVEEFDVLSHSFVSQGSKVVWGNPNPPPNYCTTPLAHTEGGYVKISTDSFGESIYFYEDGVLGSGAPGHSSYGCTVTAKLAFEWQVTTDPQFIAVQLGLTPMAMAWEVLPFSFVVDWFFKVGQFLTRLDTASSNAYIVVGASYNLTLDYKVTSNWGDSGSAVVKLRSSQLQPNGTIASGIGEFFSAPTSLIYLPSAIKPGTMVTKLDDRFRNAMALLTVLSTTLLRSRHVVDSLPLSSVERSRIFRALKKLGI